jgi:hypothetical protein
MLLEGFDPTLMDVGAGLHREVLARTMADSRRHRNVLSSVRRWTGRRLIHIGLVVAADPKLRPDLST